MTIRYVDNPAAGTQSGDSWTNAAPMSQIETLYAASMPGDEIWINSLATYSKTGQNTWTNANGLTENGRVVVRGMRKNGTVQGYPEKVTIVGGRTVPWPASGGVNSSTMVRMGSGFKFTTLQNLVGIGYERMFQTFHDDNEGITIEDCEAIGCQHGLTAGVTNTKGGWRVRRFKMLGMTGRGVSFGGTAHDILVEDCDYYGQGHDDYDTGTAGIGFMMDVASHDATFRRCRALGGFDMRPDANYWQGQGFNEEEDVYNITYEDCYSADWADAGWDSKASNTIFRRCVAERNMRNYRVHHQRVPGSAGPFIYEDCISRFPVYKGGSGSPAHIQVADGVLPFSSLFEWRAGSLGQTLFEDHRAGTPIVTIGNNVTLASGTIRDALIRMHPDALLQSGSGVTFENCTIVEET